MSEKRNILALVVITNAGCINMLADPLGRRSALKKVQLQYTQAIRWGNFEKASEFVDPDLREEFLGLLDAFEKIRVTDYDIGSIQYESSDLAKVTVTYHAYTVGTFLDRSMLGFADHHVAEVVLAAPMVFPPAVVPSWIRRVLLVRSTVISPTAPVNASFSACVPLRHCT